MRPASTASDPGGSSSPNWAGRRGSRWFLWWGRSPGQIWETQLRHPESSPESRQSGQSVYCCQPGTHWEYLDSEEGDGSLAGELEEEHEDEDDKERVEDWLLENISELKLLIAQHFGHFFVQIHQGVQVVLMESQDILSKYKILLVTRKILMRTTKS